MSDTDLKWETLESFDFSSARSQYPWSEWTDGRIVRHETDKAKSFRTALYNKAKKLHKHVHVNVKGNRVTFQFVETSASSAAGERTGVMDG